MSKKHGTKSVKAEAMFLEAQGKKQKLGVPTDKAQMNPKAVKGTTKPMAKEKMPHGKKSKKG